MTRERLWSRIGWFAQVAGAVTAAAAWRFARADEEHDPSDDEIMDALADLERAVEEQLDI